MEELEEGGAEEGGARDGEDPGVDDAARDAPADGGETPGSADANDGKTRHHYCTSNRSGRGRLAIIHSANAVQ